ncbi:hypothetical protein [Devosia sp. DBB001]|nr:hypothetical protein [Devosia sp. DBB001]
MNRIDRLLLFRLAGRIGITVLVFFGLIALVESLDAWRFSHLMETGGLPLAIFVNAVSAIRWTIKTLPVTVLLGAIIGLVEMQRTRELLIIKASGVSIWRVLRGPVLGMILAGLAISFVVEGLVVETNRVWNPTVPVGDTSVVGGNGLWLEQTDGGSPYVITARGVTRQGSSLTDVTVFYREDPTRGRVLAESGELRPGAWHLTGVRELRSDAPIEYLDSLEIPTTSTPAEVSLKLTSPEDYTLYELAQALASQIGDPSVRAAAATRLYKLFALPALLVGSLLIAFAFTAGYRRTNKYGATILYGIVLGLVVFVLTEMADRAGSSGVLTPVVAALGPAFVAITIGLTVLLYKEDGRA